MTSRALVGRPYGTELQGGVEPVPPLSDAAEGMWLSLHANGTLPAPWDMKLGARRASEALPLRSLHPGGGGVAKTLVYIERIYPVLIAQRQESGGNILRNDTAEARAVRQFEVRRAQVQDEVMHKHMRGAAFGRAWQILLATS